VTPVTEEGFQPIQATFLSDLGRTVYLDDERLRSLIVVFSSEDNISAYDIHSSCETHSEYAFRFRNLHFFTLSYLDENCNNRTIALKNNDIILSSTL